MSGKSNLDSRIDEQIEEIATSLSMLYTTVATQVGKVNQLIELADTHSKFIGAWDQFLKQGANLAQQKD